MADRAAIRRVRQALIRTGVADETMSEDEIEERAAALMRALSTVISAMRPALNAPDASGSEILHRLGDLAEVIEREDLSR